MRLFAFSLLVMATLWVFGQCGSCNQATEGAVWEGDVDSDWENPNNWSGNTLPTGGAITIDGDLYVNAPIISVNSSFSPTDVFIQDGAILTLQADLSLTDDFIIRNNSSLTIQGGSNATGDDINLCAGGSINMSGGSLDNTSGSGIIRVCTSEPTGTTGTTEINITGGTITSTTSAPETGVIDDFVNKSGGGSVILGGTPLPVELVSFVGESSANNVLLKWITASELNNDYFDIQRSWDGVNFSTIGRVAGSGTTNNSQQYEFSDVKPWKTSYYRLVQVDFDGDSEQHSVIRVENALGGDAYLVRYNHSKTEPIDIKAAFEMAEVQLINSLGQVISRNQNVSNLQISTSGLNSGIYVLQMQLNNTLIREKILIMD